VGFETIQETIEADVIDDIIHSEHYEKRRDYEFAKKLVNVINNSETLNGFD